MSEDKSPSCEEYNQALECIKNLGLKMIENADKIRNQTLDEVEKIIIKGCIAYLDRHIKCGQEEYLCISCRYKLKEIKKLKEVEKK